MDPRVNTIVTRCVGGPDSPHALIVFGDRRDQPIPCPICGRVRIVQPERDR